jgi:LacI family transcriptional regulator
MEAGMRAMSAPAALRDRPSAVVRSNDMTAIGVIRAAFDLAVNIPRDLSVVGFDDIRLVQFITPPLTTAQISQLEIADMAFSALLDSIEAQSDTSPRELYTIKTNLVLRSSTALAPDQGRVTSAGQCAHGQPLFQ